MGRRAWVTIVFAATAVMLLCLPAVVLAYDESVPQPTPPLGHSTPYGDCTKCHGDDFAGSSDCLSCHGPASGFPQTSYFAKGPHAGFLTTTNHCTICHTIHDSQNNFALLPASTITATCNTCHDGTGGRGVYGAIKARTGSDPGAMHRTETTNTVPGGNATNGDSSAGAFAGTNGALTCTDCHNPHDANTVAAFTGERLRVPYTAGREGWQSFSTNRLLKQRPSGATASVSTYGTDWCLTCHKGRSSSGMVNNHPVDSTAVRADAFVYDNVALLASDALTSTTVLGSLGPTNRGYLMPYPRTPQQGTHKPICQQCHEDSRDPGALDPNGAAGDATTHTVSLDGTLSATSPRFQNFPHETVNARMLIESNDDLCFNCHPVGVLP